MTTLRRRLVTLALAIAVPAILTAVAIPSLLERNVMVEEARP
jgi:hypothetical protein